MKGFNIIAWLMVAAAAAGIFALSSQPATQSEGLSIKISEIILESAERLKLAEAGLDEDKDKLDIFNSQLRQFAHTFIYFIFAFLLARALRHTGMSLTAALALTLFISCILAGTDEWHQSFIQGRGSELKDFVSDAAGTMAAIILGVLGQAYGVMTRKISHE